MLRKRLRNIMKTLFDINMDITTTKIMEVVKIFTVEMTKFKKKINHFFINGFFLFDK